MRVEQDENFQVLAFSDLDGGKMLRKFWGKHGWFFPTWMIWKLLLGRLGVKTFKNHMNQLDHDLTSWRNSGMMGGWIRGTTPKWLNIPAMFRFSELKCEREQRGLWEPHCLSGCLRKVRGLLARDFTSEKEISKQKRATWEKATYTAFTLKVSHQRKLKSDAHGQWGQLWRWHH